MLSNKAIVKQYCEHTVFKILMMWCLMRFYFEKVAQYIRKQIPSTVLDVHYIDPQSRIALPLYAPSFPIIARWSSWYSYHLNSDFAHTPGHGGMYAIRVWNQAQARYENYMLTPDHLLNALHLRNIAAFWAYSDIGIVTLLHQFAEAQKHCSSAALSITDMTVDGIPALHDFKQYMQSLMLPNNMNAYALAVWFTFMRWEQNEKGAAISYPLDKTPEVVITDDNLDEHTFTNKQYMFCGGKKDE
jgi:hypothetical protein